MVVSVNFYGMQRLYTQTEQISVPLLNQIRVTDLLEIVQGQFPNLPLDQNTFLVTVNQEIAHLETVLNPNDNICFLPHIGGG